MARGIEDIDGGMTMNEMPLDMVVSRVRPIASDVIEVELRHPDGAPLPPFSAGAHIDIRLAPNLVRQYSLVNDEAERDRYVIAVKRRIDGRGGSIEIHDRASERATLVVSALRNTFELVRDEAPILLLAAGIGITPMLSMARVLTRQGRHFTLHYSARHRSRPAFVEELLDLGPTAAVHLYETGGPDGVRLDLGRVAAIAQRRTRVYACGPESFMQEVTLAFAALPEVELRTEYFSAPASPVVNAGSFMVTLARSQKSFVVPPDRTILNGMRELGLEPEVSCEQGVCGTCMTNVLSGQIDHHDYVLTPTERASGRCMTICVSRGVSGGSLLLDL